MPTGYLLALMAATIATLVFVERFWPATEQRVEWLNNGIAFGLTGIGQFLVATLSVLLVASLVNALGGGLVDLRALPLAVGAVVYLVAMDLGEYLFHRAQHAIPLLWAMHSLHHSDRGLSVTTTQRHFWLEPCLKSVSIWLAVALLFRTSGPILAVYAAASLYHFIAHANLRLGFGRFSWLLNSPQYHRLHHSRDPRHHNANYAALLPIFDVLSGAYRRPARGEFPATGLDVAPASPLELLTWPVRGVLQTARRILVRDKAGITAR